MLAKRWEIVQVKKMQNRSSVCLLQLLSQKENHTFSAVEQCFYTYWYQTGLKIEKAFKVKGESSIHPSIHRCRADVVAFQSLTHPYFVSLLRTTEWTSSWDSSGTTLGWPTASTPTTRWTLTPLCWTPSGNLTCSSLTRRAPTSTRSPLTTSCYASLKTATCSTAYGEWRKCELLNANCE